MHLSSAIPIELPPSEKHTFKFHITRLSCDLRALQAQFGPPQFRDFVDGIGDADYWAFLYPCGMKLLYEFSQGLAPASHGFANVYGDLPEFEHARRHIPFSQCVSFSAGEANAVEIAAFRKIEPWATAISNFNVFQVWRQGDDGNEMPVGLPTSERDAQCWVQELESHGHKQMYWYSSLQPTRSMP